MIRRINDTGLLQCLFSKFLPASSHVNFRQQVERFGVAGVHFGGFAEVTDREGVAVEFVVEAAEDVMRFG